MTTQEILSNIINLAKQKAELKEVKEYLPQLKYIEGQIDTLTKYKNFLDLDIPLTHKDCLEYLNKLYSNAQRLQIDLVGFQNKTGKPNLDGCFYLGKMVAAKKLKENLLNN